MWRQSRAVAEQMAYRHRFLALAAEGRQQLRDGLVQGQLTRSASRRTSGTVAQTLVNDARSKRELGATCGAPRS